jgi:hypothetical protein
MKRVLLYVVLATGLAAAGWACWSASKLEQHVADAERSVAAFQYLEAVPAFERAERYYTYTSRVPWIGAEQLHDIQIHRAELAYWQQDYAAIIPQQADAIGALPQDNTGLQFVVANAMYRVARSRATDQKSLIAALDTGIAAQLAVLKNSVRNEDAAFNHEYLVRLRASIGARATPQLGKDAGADKRTHGQPGGEPLEADKSEFKIHIPLEPEEYQDQKEGHEAGKSVVRERKG